jgi:uncharacterized damage-inducible protein DinB
VSALPILRPPHRAEKRTAGTALRGQLESLRDVVATLPIDAYRAAPARVSGTVGEHVRHCLDHVRALVSHGGSGELSYDSRLRGTQIEIEPGAAVEQIDSLCEKLEKLEDAPADTPVSLRSLTERDGTTLSTTSTLGREIAFVIQHTIHHLAIVAVLLDQIGIQVPTEFGLAPSTPHRH